MIFRNIFFIVVLSLSSFLVAKTNEISIEKIEINEFNIKIFINDMEKISFQIEDNLFQLEKKIVLDFQKEDKTNTIIRDIFFQKNNINIGKIHLEYYSSELYKKLGINNNGVVNFFVTNNIKLNLKDNDLDEFNNIVNELKYIYSFINDLSKNVNVKKICSDSIAKELIGNMKKNKCTVACSGKAIIARDYLLSKNIDTRLLILKPNFYTNENGILIQLSEGHTTLEVKYKNIYFVSDVTLGFIYVKDKNDNLLSANELIYNIKRSEKVNLYNYELKNYNYNFGRYYTKDKIIKYKE